MIFYAHADRQDLDVGAGRGLHRAGQRPDARQHNITCTTTTTTTTHNNDNTTNLNDIMK